MISTTFINAANTMTRGINTFDIDLFSQCTGDSTQKYFRIIWDYVYTTQNTQLDWTIQITGLNGGSLGNWAITQVLLLSKSCDKRCLICTTSTVTCTACTNLGTWESFLVSTNSTCVDAASCPVRTYAEVADHTCKACTTTNCQICHPGNVCT